MSIPIDPPVYAPVWLSQADVIDWLRANGQPVDGEIDRICKAAEIHVQEKRPDQFTTDDPPVYAPDAQVYQGAVMWAAREIRRRNNPSGVQEFAGIGISFVAKFDPDIDAALHTGAYLRPKTG
jgi:hypothetical protein